LERVGQKTKTRGTSDTGIEGLRQSEQTISSEQAARGNGLGEDVSLNELSSHPSDQSSFINKLDEDTSSTEKLVRRISGIYSKDGKIDTHKVYKAVKDVRKVSKI